MNLDNNKPYKLVWSILVRAILGWSISILVGCAGGPVGWGGTDEVLFSDANTIKIQWDNLTTNEDAVRQKANAHCGRSGRGVQQIDASADPFTFGVIRSRTWRCVDRGAVTAAEVAHVPQVRMSVGTGTSAPMDRPPTAGAPEGGTGGLRGIQSSTNSSPAYLTAKRHVGKDGLQAEKLAKGNQCSAAPVPTLAAQGPGFENYAVLCDNKDTLLIRCEFGTCRVLK